MFALATLQRTTSLFPTQFEGTTADGRPVYIRCKHGELSVRVGPAGGLIDDAIGAAPAISLEFADDDRSELDWIEIEPLTGIRLPPDNSGIAIEDATATDAKAIAALLRRARDEALPHQSQHHDAAADLRFVAGRIADGLVRVARSGRIVAFCARRAGWVDCIYVDRDARGRGVGSRLLGEALIGADPVHLRTFQRNEGARIFFIRRGFDEVERTDGSANEDREPDILMRWQRGLLS